MFLWMALDQDAQRQMGLGAETVTRTLVFTLFTFEVELKANVAEGQSSCFCLQFTDAADIIVVQINVLKLLLFLHVGPATKRRRDIFRCFNQL